MASDGKKELASELGTAVGTMAILGPEYFSELRKFLETNPKKVSAALQSIINHRNEKADAQTERAASQPHPDELELEQKYAREYSDAVFVRARWVTFIFHARDVFGNDTELVDILAELAELAPWLKE